MTFVFGNCEIHCDRRELHRNGSLIRVEPQVFDVLVHLVRHRDRVVSKEELIRAVWDGRVVSDDALTSRVSAARRAIGDTGAEQRLIRTVTRRGFRFVGDVREDPDISPTPTIQLTDAGYIRASAERQILPDGGPRPSGRCDNRSRYTVGQDCELAESPRIRLAESGVVTSLQPAGRTVHTGAV